MNKILLLILLATTATASNYFGGTGAGIPTYANFAALPACGPTNDGAAAITVDTDTIYVCNGGTTTWTPVGGSGVALSVGTIDGVTASSDGASLSANKIYMQSASSSKPGLVNNTTQTFSGAKTFSTAIAAGSGGTGQSTYTIGDGLFASSSSALSKVSTGAAGTVLTSTGTSALPVYSPIPAPANNSITNAMLAQMPANTIKGNNTGSTANAADLTVAQTNTLLGDILANGTVPFSSNQSMGSNKLTSVTDPTSAQDAATKNYVDTVASGLNPKQAVYAASTANITGTYLNGVACVGATFTITATGALSLDGVSPPVGSRVLLKDQSSGFQNGVYDVTVAGTTGVSPILTRSLDYNTSTDMNAGDLIPVINGTANAVTSWLQTSVISTCGSDSLTFTEWSYNPAGFLLKTNNLSDVSVKATSFNNLSPMTTQGDLIYGGASGTGTRLALGATNSFLTSNGTIPAWSSLLGVAQGGTGLSSYTVGDVPYASATTTITKLPIGTAGYVLTSTGTIPTWSPAAGGGGGGTVTSVGLSLPAEFTVSNVPVTTAGTPTAVWVSQTAGMIMAAPTASPTPSPTNVGTPAYRYLNTNDLSVGLVGMAYIPQTAACDPTRTSATLGAFTDDTDCPGPTINTNPGTKWGVLQTTDANNIKFTVNSLVAGTYEVCMGFRAYSTGGAGVSIYWAINDGTTSSGQGGLLSNYPGTTVNFPVYTCGVFTYTVTANITYTLFGAASASDITVPLGQTGTYVNFIIKKVF